MGCMSAEVFEVGAFEVTLYDDGDMWLESSGWRDADGVFLDFEDLERLYLAAKARRAGVV